MIYRIGWEKDGRWRYITVGSKEEMIAEVADKTTLSDKVSIRAIKRLKLEKEEEE